MSKSALTTVEKSINKKYGDVIIGGSDLIEADRTIIPTTLSLDIALNGGIVDGTTVSIAGTPGSGKSTLALNILANAQKLGKSAVYVDIENRLQRELLTSVKALDLKSLRIVKSTKGNFLTAEKFLNITETILATEPNIVLVFDSVAALCTEASHSTEHGDSVRMMGVSSLMYSSTRKLAQILPSMGSNIIFITHLQANPSPYGGPSEFGGNAIKYQASYRLTCMSSKEVPKEGEKKTGRESEFKILKSALGPGTGSATFYIKYGEGYDYKKDIVCLAEQIGLITKAGSWYSFTDPETNEEVKAQGFEGVIEHLSANPKILTSMEEAIKTMFTKQV